MRYVNSWVVAGLLSLVASGALCDERPAIRNYQNARTALQGAKAVARAGRGQILAVGGLMTEASAPSNSVVVLEHVDQADLRPGMVLIMERIECPTQVCLIARRVTSTQGSIETEPYPTIEGLLFTPVEATVLGAVAYAVDLDTDTIRDLRPGHIEALSFDAAITQERRSQDRHTLVGALARP